MPRPSQSSAVSPAAAKHHNLAETKTLTERGLEEKEKLEPVHGSPLILFHEFIHFSDFKV